MSKYSEKVAAQKGQDAPVVTVDISEITARLEKRFTPLFVKDEQVKELRTQAAQLVARAREIMANPIFVEMRDLNELNNAALKDIEQAEKDVERSFENDPVVQFVLDKAWRNNQLSVVEPIINREKAAKKQSMAAAARQLHLECHAKLTELEAIRAKLVAEADRIGVKGKAGELFKEARELEAKDVVLAL